jgi:signal transduction histidine kinase
MPLFEVLAARRSDVMLLWTTQVRNTLAPEDTSAIELTNHIPRFLDEIVAALTLDAGLPSGSPTAPVETNTAAGHGAQRLRLGFSLDAIIREYGLLRDAIVEVARHSLVELTFRELQIVFDCIIGGIAHAVSEYTRRRDAEFTRQANEHFAFVAHELRNPLSAATMAFQLLKAQGHFPTGRPTSALERGLRRTSELIDQTLQTARATAGIDLRREATTLSALIDDAVLGALPEAESKAITIRVAIAQDATMSLDVRLVRSALVNLVLNGVKYTHKQSTIELRAGITEGKVLIEVEDCCGGIAPETIEKAFAPFMRFDKSQKGFGLGLAIARQAAEAHGGTIYVKNLPGKGCVFLLELPVATPEA